MSIEKELFTSVKLQIVVGTLLLILYFVSDKSVYLHFRVV
jgi:hypothetical protein